MRKRIWKKLVTAGIFTLLLLCTWGVTALASGFEETEGAGELLEDFGQVQNLKQTKATDSTITISWSHLSGAQAYGINMRVSDSGSFSRIDEIYATGKTMSYTIKGLKSNTFYDVQVFAGSASDPVGMTKTIRCRTTPGKIVGLSYSSDTEKKKMTFQWNRKQTADGYELYKYSLAGKLLSRYEVPKSSLSKIQKTIGVGSNFYSYRIRGFCTINGTKCRGALRTFYTSLQPELSTKVVSSGSTGVKLTWSKINGVTNYQVYLSTSANGTYKKVATSKTNQAVISGLQKGKTYYVTVYATKTIGGKVQKSPFTYYWKFTKK